MGGGSPRANAPIALRPDRPRLASSATPVPPPPPPRPPPSFPPPPPSPQPSSVTPAPPSSFLRRQEPAQPPCPPPSRLPQEIHPSPLPGGRLGGGWKPASQRTNRLCPDRPRLASPSPQRLLRHPCGLLRHPRASSVTPAPPPPPLPPLTVIPVPSRHSCAGRNDGEGAQISRAAAGVGRLAGGDWALAPSAPMAPPPPPPR